MWVLIGIVVVVCIMLGLNMKSGKGTEEPPVVTESEENKVYRGELNLEPFKEWDNDYIIPFFEKLDGNFDKDYLMEKWTNILETEFESDNLVTVSHLKLVKHGQYLTVLEKDGIYYSIVHSELITDKYLNEIMGNDLLKMSFYPKKDLPEDTIYIKGLLESVSGI